MSGKQGSAAYLQSANAEFLAGGDPADLSMGDIDFTLGCWVYLNAKTTGGVVGKWRGNTNRKEYMIFYNAASDRFCFSVSSDGAAAASLAADSLGAPSTGRWYFILAWHDAAINTLNIQINHGAVDSAAHSGGVYDGTIGFTLGRYIDSGGTARLLDGCIDEACIYKCVLTAAERLFLYQSAAAGRVYSELARTPTPAALASGQVSINAPQIGLYDTRVRLRARARDTYLTTRVR